MKDDLESQLRAALRPVEAPPGLSRKILARLADPPQPKHRPLATRRSAWWLSAGIAASLLVSIGVYTRIQNERETAAGLEARREVLQALQLTHQKLDLAYQTVKDQAGGTS